MIKFPLHNKGDMPVNVSFTSVENDENVQFHIKNPNMIVDGNMRALLEVKVVHRYVIKILNRNIDTKTSLMINGEQQITTS